MDLTPFIVLKRQDLRNEWLLATHNLLLGVILQFISLLGKCFISNLSWNHVTMSALKEELVGGFARVYEVHDISVFEGCFLSELVMYGLFVHLSAEKTIPISMMTEITILIKTFATSLPQMACCGCCRCSFFCVFVELHRDLLNFQLNI